MTKRHVVWFSCGVTSAITAKIVLKDHPSAEIVYCDTNSEHSDNHRFIADCEKWYGKKIQVLRSSKYFDIFDVFEKRHYLVGHSGFAVCTFELKKRLRQEYEDLENDIQYFGFDISEQNRYDRFIKNNPEVNLRAPLIEKKLTKNDCLQMLKKSGIETPVMYKMGYNNNNCIGCVKGGAGYWNKIRKDFPEVFKRMAELERTLGATITKYKGKKIYLDELPLSAGNHKDLDMSCDLLCGALGIVCEHCGCGSETCNTELWAQQKKCCPDCTHGKETQ